MWSLHVLRKSAWVFLLLPWTGHVCTTVKMMDGWNDSSLVQISGFAFILILSFTYQLLYTTNTFIFMLNQIKCITNCLVLSKIKKTD